MTANNSLVTVTEIGFLGRREINYDKCMPVTRSVIHRQLRIDRHELETLTLVQLKEEARCLGVPVSDNREHMLDAIITLMERRAIGGAPSASQGEVRSASATSTRTAGNSLQQICATLALQMQQQQQVLTQILSTLRENNSGVSGRQLSAETVAQEECQY